MLNPIDTKAKTAAKRQAAMIANPACTCYNRLRRKQSFTSHFRELACADASFLPDTTHVHLCRLSEWFTEGVL